MKAAEIEKRFKAGDKLVKQFFTNSIYHYIGDARITVRQFNATLKNIPHTRQMDFTGFTKHIYTYKP